MLTKKIVSLGGRTLSAIFAAVVTTACSSEPVQEARLSPADAAQATASSWQCPAQPGAAPTGELTAERIPGANSRRQEPGLYEGPVWLNDALYFSDFTFAEGFPSRIMRLQNGEMTIALENSGSNGLALGQQGQLLAATHDRKAISRVSLESGERETIVAEYAQAPFNSPNDLTASDNGGIYFTDPDYQRSAAPGGQPKTRVYKFVNGEVEVVDDSLQNPNGISLSPDQQTLYVAGGTVLRSYPIKNGEVGEGSDLAELNGPDGMAIDCLGNVYATEHGQQRLRVFSPKGEELAIIKVDANVTNAAFGGPERKTLYITGAGAVWKLPLNVAGLPY